jgi:glycosyltransferase involved in cell wall biosynthesis
MSSVESAKISDTGMPAVSVIIPTFNRSKLVVNAVESVLCQTYRDYELIVVDDGSTDNTAEALMPYMDRIRYVYQANLGTSAAKNKGIQVATGKWISVLDSDDLWLPIKLETQLNVVATLGKDFGACFTNCDFFGTTHAMPSAFEQGGLDEELPFGPLEEPFKILLARYPAIYVQSLLVLRSLVEYPNGFDERLVVTEDTDLLFRLAFNTKFCFVNERLVRIDRTPSREVGLMELFYSGDDRAFASREHLLQKWICLAENMDPGLRRTLEELLKGLYYNWLVTKLYRFRYVKAFEIAGRIKATGDNNKTICRTVASRAKRKISSLVNQFHSS